MLRIEIDGKIVELRKFRNCWYTKLPKQGQVQIFFEPWKTTPKIRINHFLLNTHLANIQCWDHMYEFKWTPCFFDNYFENLLKSRPNTFSVGEYYKEVTEQIYEKITINKFT